ncbi:unnamed protein product [Phytophthora fragariaefolia]|uniref:Unnamed protein product n=1 Tax=Phytophthora fragariaefolia TaxID=1490495 RepID=A0A9W6YPN4_9STRA|nr:unnamed protein product [Phytophthora fragariaefolia]
MELTAESPGSEEDSAVTGVGDLVEADPAPARGALDGVGKVEVWPPGWPELGGELGPAVSAADGTDGGAIVGETGGQCQLEASRSSRQPRQETQKSVISRSNRGKQQGTRRTIGARAQHDAAPSFSKLR